MSWSDPWLQLIDNLLQWDRWRGSPSDGLNTQLLAPSPPTPEDLSLPECGYPHPSGPRCTPPVQAGGFFLRRLNLGHRIRSLLAGFSARRRTQEVDK